MAKKVKYEKAIRTAIVVGLIAFFILFSLAQAEGTTVGNFVKEKFVGLTSSQKPQQQPAQEPAPAPTAPTKSGCGCGKR